MALRVECIKMEEQMLLLLLLLLENLLLKVLLLLEDERTDWVNRLFDERQRSVASFILCSQCCWSKHKIFPVFYNGARHILVHRT